jgi:outer membrane immunogenic protein
LSARFAFEQFFQKGVGMKQIALAIGIAMLACGSSVAADMAVKTGPRPVAVTNWTGCYLGAGGGYGMFNQKREVVGSAANPFAASPTLVIAGVAPTGTVFVPNETSGGEGWLATAQVGCDYQFASNLLIGGFVDGDWTNMRGDHGLFGIFRGEQNMRWSYAVGGRVGWLVTPSLLAFFSGGYTETEFSGVNYGNNSGVSSFSFLNHGVSNLTVNATGNPGIVIPSQRFNGFFIGGGTEYAIGQLPGLFWKTEYRYADYRSAQTNIACPTCTVFGLGITPGQTGLAERQHPTVQTIRTEVVWRFNWGGPSMVAKY